VVHIMPVSCKRLDLAALFPGRRDAYAVVVDGLFTPEECAEMIKRTEAIGYTEALVGGGQVRVESARNNWRCMIDDAAEARRMYKRVAPFVPTEWLGYKPAGLNERLRFLKYHPGEHFKPHNDGIYVRDDKSQASFITVQVYLNDVEEGCGGETTFTTQAMSYGRHKKKGGRDEDRCLLLPVRPVTGRVLIFEHHLPHEGSTLLRGVKYAVRTDVMYDLAGDPPVRTPRWQRKFPHPQWKCAAM
jgi:predicted 2-oxoglutarate/Fe(II)-dependent dioxygenase YbiX